MYLFDEKVGRRRFIRGAATTAAAGAAGATIAGCGSFGAAEHSVGVDKAAAGKWGREAGEWIPSCCNMCGGQSGVLVHVVDGVVEKIEPNSWNPNNYSNISSDFLDGYTEEFGVRDGAVICPKGNAAIAQLYDPDRLQKPLKRTNPDKSPDADPKWEEISWDKALDEIAAKLGELRDAGEAHKLLWVSEDHSFVDVQSDFCKLYGTPNYSNHSNLCDVARKASFKVVMGDDRPLADFIESKYILLFGWNPTSAIKWVYLPRIITQAVERGARLVVVDPYLSDTAAKAQEWVSIRPGTDGALALAMGHVIIREKLHDRRFIKRWTVGFDEYADFVADKTPEWAEEITGVPAATIERLAIELATTKPALVDVWSGPGQQSNGVQGGRAIALLNTLIGAWDRPGGMLIPNKKGGKHIDLEPGAEAEETVGEPFFDQRDTYPLFHKSGVYTQMFTNLLEGSGPYDAKMMINVFQNVAMSVPGRANVQKALAKLETLVVIDTMMSETAQFADYVLPGTTYLERYDLNSHWVTWPVLGLRQPVVKPLFGQPAEYEVVTELGRRLALKDAGGVEVFSVGAVSGRPVEDTTAWYEEYLSNQLVQGEPAISLDDLKALPGAVWVSESGTAYEKYEGLVADDKLAVAWFDGDDPAAEGTGIYDKPKEEGGKRMGTILYGKPMRGFYTGSGKVEFVTPSLADKPDALGNAVDPRPVYTPRDWVPDNDYPLYLINWKEASHTHTRTQNNPWLLDVKPENPLVINPDTADRYGIGDGDTVVVESKYGKVEATAKVTRRMHPEVVGLQHGFGHTALGELAKDRGTADAWLRPTKADALSGMALHKETCVRIRRAFRHLVPPPAFPPPPKPRGLASRDDALAKVTATHLRRAESMCRLRLAREHADARGNRGSGARFAVANRVVADARQAHATLRAATARDFPAPTDLFPEQQHLYAAAAAGYLVRFGDVPARTADPALLDQWETRVEALGVRLVGDVGVAIEGPQGEQEVRVLRVGGRTGGRPALDDVDVKFATLRAASWAPERLRLVAANLVEGTAAQVDVDVGATLPETRDWLAARVDAIRALVADPRAKPGADCRGCGFVSGCPAHRDA